MRMCLACLRDLADANIGGPGLVWPSSVSAQDQVGMNRSLSRFYLEGRRKEARGLRSRVWLALVCPEGSLSFLLNGREEILVQ